MKQPKTIWIIIQDWGREPHYILEDDDIDCTEDEMTLNIIEQFFGEKK